jgi:frataxin-like iron-binding protein CyaY
MNFDTPVEKIEESILSVGDRVAVIYDDLDYHGKVIRIDFGSGEVVVMNDLNGQEHRHQPQNIRKDQS